MTNVTPLRGLDDATRKAVERKSGGVFVLDPQKRSELLECLELRLAIEAEAAGYAATRATPAQRQRIAECLEDMAAMVDKRRSASAADFAFHMAVADAANNRYFVKFLMALGMRAVPRARPEVHALLTEEGITQERALIDEHERVLGAINSGKPEVAREAMRGHLIKAIKRYSASHDRGTPNPA
ncbi:MAG: FCD domain-containing protein [Pseudomonadota bacterium]